jgi:hypothetical protein
LAQTFGDQAEPFWRGSGKRSLPRVEVERSGEQRPERFRRVATIEKLGPETIISFDWEFEPR